MIRVLARGLWPQIIDRCYTARLTWTIKDANQMCVVLLQKYINQAEKDKVRYQKDLEK
jgi:hypothetical protein